MVYVQLVTYATRPVTVPAYAGGGVRTAKRQKK